MSIMLSVTNKPCMLNVIILSVVMLIVIMLSVVMLSVIMLSVVMLSVMAPDELIRLLPQGCNHWSKNVFWYFSWM